MPEDITNYDGRLEQMAYYCEAMLDNIAKVNNAYHDSVEDAYVEALPSTIIKWKGIKQIGGKTLVWNQLVDTGIAEVGTVSGHKYYTLINGTESIVTSDGTAIAVVNDAADMVTDLTLCFGIGNEPSTSAEFTAIFGASHYDYNPGTLLTAGVTEVVSKDANDSTLQTIPIPPSIRNLEGYGWSAGSVYNYIDYERKVFVKCVDRVELDGRTWTSAGDNPYFMSVFTGAKNCAGNKVSNAISNKYVSASFNSGISPKVSNTIFVNASYIYCYTDGVNTPTGHLYYELATPQEIDISEYLTDDNLINVEAGGTLTFHNQNGDNYKIPVPVKLEYIGL